MAAPTNTYNSVLELYLGQVPDGIEDPIVYQELLDLHNAIEAILTHSDGNDTPTHDDLEGVTPDQHHPQLHTLPSHTDVNFSGDPTLQTGHGIWYDGVAGEWRNRTSATETWPTGLADGGELNIGGPIIFSEDFDAADIPVFSDTFDRTLPAPWSPSNGNPILTIDAQRLSIEATTTNARSLLSTTTGIVITDNWYTFTASVGADSDWNGRVIGGPASYGQVDTFDTSVILIGASKTITFISLANTIFIQTLPFEVPVAGEKQFYDNVFIDYVPALDGWLPIDAESLVSVVNGRLRLENGDATVALVGKEFVVLPASSYRIEIDNPTPLNGGALLVGTALGAQDVNASVALNAGLNIIEFTTVAETSVFLSLNTNSITTAVQREFDNITVKNANGIEVLAGLGAVIDGYTTPLAPPILKGLSWPQLNELITAAPSVAGSVVWFSITDTGVPADPSDLGGIPLFVGEINQFAQPPNPTLSRQEIFLGTALHNGVEWKEVSNPKVINQAAETLREIATTVLQLSTIISGGAVSEQTSFALDQAEGVIWENNRNWHNDKSDPNRETLPASTPISFQYVTQDFSDVETPTTAIDPIRYDDGSATPVPVPGPANAATIQKLYLDPANNYWVLWGQFVYPNFLTAQAHLNADLATSVIPFILQNSILLGFAIVENAKNDWDANEAVFVPTGGKAGAGGGGTPITDHDNLNGITPDNHHNQVHLLYGSDHSDINTTDTLDLGDVLMYNGTVWVPFDALDTFVAAGYGGIVQSTPVGLLNINATEQTIPADTVVITVPKAVTQDLAGNGIRFGFSGVWMFNVSFSIVHDESNASRQFLVEIFNVDLSVVTGVTVVAVARNQPGTNMSVSAMIEVSLAVVDDLFVVRLVSPSDIIAAVTLVDYQLSVSLVSELTVIP